MTPLNKITVPQCFRSADQADFYRRGWRDAEAGKAPQELKGYAAALVLAYASGGMDAACAR